MVSIPSSNPDISLNEALKLTDELCKLFYESGMEEDLVLLHKVGKQLTSLYFDCKNNRYELSEHLVELQFLEFAIKMMKRLNNIGVFKNDDVWFASFYLYNICWNYSEDNQSFASSLITYGVEPLLISNIMHDPYIDNLSKKNVNYLIKATLSIIHNILRVPGNRMYFISENVINALLKIASKDDKLSVLSTMCLSYIASNDNVINSPEFDIFYNVKLLFFYIKKASETGGKFKGFNLYEFFEVLKSGSLSKIQKEAIVKLDGFEVMIEHLKSTKEERLKRDIILSLVNIYDEKYKPRIKEIAKFYLPNKSEMIMEAAKTLSWGIDVIDKVVENNENLIGGKVFINFINRDHNIAEKIFEKLGNVPKLPLVSHEDNVEKLRNSYDEAAIIVVCVSESFKNSISFKIGSEYCLWKNKTVFPVLVQNNYKPEGWVKDFIVQASDVCYNFSTDHDMNSEMKTFLSNFQTQLDNLKDEKEMPLVVIETPFTVSRWLREQNLNEILPKLADIDMSMLYYMKKIRSEAPEYYFKSLENNLKLSFMEVMKLSAALDNLQ